MSSITASPDIAQVKPEEVQRFVDIFCHDVVQNVNGKLDFQTNFSCKILDVAFTAQDTEQAIPHGLGRVPNGYFMVGSDLATTVYDGDSSDDGTNIYLKSTQITTSTRLVVY